MLTVFLLVVQLISITLKILLTLYQFPIISVVVWVRMAPSNSYSWMLSHQGVKLFGRIRWFRKHGLVGGRVLLGMGLWCFKSPCQAHCLCLWIRALKPLKHHPTRTPCLFIVPVMTMTMVDYPSETVNMLSNAFLKELLWCGVLVIPPATPAPKPTTKKCL